MIDYHTHTYLCKHAIGDPEAYLKKAEKEGLSELGVSDHAPWPIGYDSHVRMSIDEFPIYNKIIENLRSKAKNVKIKYGIEMDWVPWMKDKMEEVFSEMEQYGFDYILGSVHYTETLPFDSPEALPVWKQEGKEEWIWQRYYEHLLEYVSFGKFNIISHFDLPKKFGSKFPSTETITKLIDQILTAASDNKIAMEINTSGLRRAPKEQYPSFNILQQAAKKGVMLTFGSDAHDPQDVAANFNEVRELAKEAGFKSYTSFTQQKPTQIPL